MHDGSVQVIPGIFVALMLRKDVSTGFRTSYFQSGFGGYMLGLALTIVIMNIFETAQPALLYIVPAVLGCVFLHASMRGEAKEVRNGIARVHTHVCVWELAADCLQARLGCCVASCFISVLY